MRLGPQKAPACGGAQPNGRVFAMSTRKSITVALAILRLLQHGTFTARGYDVWAAIVGWVVFAAHKERALHGALS
jgi:hypothetical protein